VEVTEAFADGQATAADVLAALQDIGIDGVTLESVTGMDPVRWAKYGAGDSAEVAADIADIAEQAEGVWEAAYAAEKSAQAGLLRDIFGNPFRPAKVKRSWLKWNNGTVVKLARSIDDERAFDRLPVLADALEEAGCTDADLLGHLRSRGPHVRGCFPVDLLLGKS
jgi:hypothetical protein